MAAKKKAVKKRVVKKRAVKKRVTKKRVVKKAAPKKRVVKKAAPKKRRVVRRKKNPIERAGRVYSRSTRRGWVVVMKHNGKMYYVTSTVNGIPLSADTDEKKAMEFPHATAKNVASKLGNEYPDNAIFIKKCEI